MNISGKAFEDRFRKDWKKCFPNTFILRIPDQLSGLKNSNNICDFICYNNSILWLVECKGHKGASIPFENISQYEKMSQCVGMQGVRAGIVLYLYDKDKVFYVPVSTITQMKKDGKKSVGLKAVEEGYRIVEIPSTKLRVFLESDYTYLVSELKEGE